MEIRLENAWTLLAIIVFQVVVFFCKYDAITLIYIELRNDNEFMLNTI